MLIDFDDELFPEFTDWFDRLAHDQPVIADQLRACLADLMNGGEIRTEYLRGDEAVSVYLVPRRHLLAKTDGIGILLHVDRRGIAVRFSVLSFDLSSVRAVDEAVGRIILMIERELGI